jgi:hypothetical protein
MPDIIGIGSPFLLLRDIITRRISTMVSIVHTSKFNPDGSTNVKPSAFRSWISNESGAKFAPEADRYVFNPVPLSQFQY